MLMISVTGSVLVYRNELSRAATPAPRISTGSGPRLTDDELKQAAARLYPGYTPTSVTRFKNEDQAVEVWLRQGDDLRKRLFDVRSGADLADAIPPGIARISQLIDLHDNLLSGTTGLLVNGCAALAVFVIALTGLVIWWPGAKVWRRSLVVPRGVGFRRTVWHLHSMVGFWTLGFTTVFALSGAYFAFPDSYQAIADWIEPVSNPDATRVTDRVIYWLAYLHFGRINGIGIPCNGPGLCDQAVKATWAFFGQIGRAHV